MTPPHAVCRRQGAQVASQRCRILPGGKDTIVKIELKTQVKIVEVNMQVRGAGSGYAMCGVNSMEEKVKLIYS
jgi:hypothetical protein